MGMCVEDVTMSMTIMLFRLQTHVLGRNLIRMRSKQRVWYAGAHYGDCVCASII